MIPDSSPQGNPSPTMESQPNIEQLIADAAARGKQAQDEEEAKIEAALAEHQRENVTKRQLWIASLDGLPEWVAPYVKVYMVGLVHPYGEFTLPGCAPIMINQERELRVHENFSIAAPDMDDDYAVQYEYSDPYPLTQFDRAVYHAKSEYAAWAFTNAEVERLNAAGIPPTPPPTAVAPQPSTVDTAADLLKQFVNGDTLITYEYIEENINMVCADDRAVLLAAPLIAIAQAVTRIADALEARHG